MVIFIFQNNSCIFKTLDNLNKQVHLVIQQIILKHVIVEWDILERTVNLIIVNQKLVIALIHHATRV